MRIYDWSTALWLIREGRRRHCWKFGVSEEMEILHALGEALFGWIR